MGKDSDKLRHPLISLCCALDGQADLGLHWVQSPNHCIGHAVAPFSLAKLHSFKAKQIMWRPDGSSPLDPRVAHSVM